MLPNLSFNCAVRPASPAPKANEVFANATFYNVLHRWKKRLGFGCQRECDCYIAFSCSYNSIFTGWAYIFPSFQRVNGFLNSLIFAVSVPALDTNNMMYLLPSPFPYNFRAHSH